MTDSTNILSILITQDVDRQVDDGERNCCSNCFAYATDRRRGEQWLRDCEIASLREIAEPWISLHETRVEFDDRPDEVNGRLITVCGQSSLYIQYDEFASSTNHTRPACMRLSPAAPRAPTGGKWSEHGGLVRWHRQI
jgi:hypothetical protein